MSEDLCMPHVIAGNAMTTYSELEVLAALAVEHVLACHLLCVRLSESRALGLLQSVLEAGVRGDEWLMVPPHLLRARHRLLVFLCWRALRIEQPVDHIDHIWIVTNLHRAHPGVVPHFLGDERHTRAQPVVHVNGGTRIAGVFGLGYHAGCLFLNMFRPYSVEGDLTPVLAAPVHDLLACCWAAAWEHGLAMER
eukprot:CAMPEP_0181186336 /NCGR_PEP_ID=MMETSP1096-20121128/9980_1 /TAXON_ID=156174 ORGANISM="Chrysochromulina ericina, Strain CCMP281" /NCGR_SAMPLE_ID=MMETSP1096 /ASSEMBLY_ACC=CAM_ASM_000453 /LENGTH=193 /DNA_ID=CAMNT_0023275227 /DNA_START=295 /DNA_END=873 /DNA_ORIENTATION=+